MKEGLEVVPQLLADYYAALYVLQLRRKCVTRGVTPLTTRLSLTLPILNMLMINLRHVQIIVKLLRCVQQVKHDCSCYLLQFVSAANLFMTLAAQVWRFNLPQQMFSPNAAN